MRIVGVVQARMGATRLPGKVLADIEGKTMLDHVWERVRGCRDPRTHGVQDVVLSIPHTLADKPLQKHKYGEDVYRYQYYAGSEYDLVERLYHTAVKYKAEAIVRVTADCPMTDPDVIHRVIAAHLGGDYDYTSNVTPPTYPDGLDVEVYPTKTLRYLHETVKDKHFREWPAVCVWEDESLTKHNVANDIDLSHLRWTVDYPEDLEFVRAVYAELGCDFRMHDVLELLQDKPELAEINAQHTRGEGTPAEVHYG